MSLDNEMDQMVRANETESLRAEVARLTSELAQARNVIHEWEESEAAKVVLGPILSEETEKVARLTAELAAMKTERDGLAAALHQLQSAARDVTNYYFNDYGLSAQQVTKLHNHLNAAIGDTPAAILAAVKAREKAEGRAEGFREASRRLRYSANEQDHDPTRNDYYSPCEQISGALNSEADELDGLASQLEGGAVR
jgi:DNA repair exonuclease SbcCD ATPase subunit